MCWISNPVVLITWSLVLHHVAPHVTSSRVTCHMGCMCMEMSGQYHVTCLDLDLQQIPRDLPASTARLELRGNSLGNLSSASFPQLHALRSLALLDSGITNIQNGTFHGFTELRQLDLKNNMLRVIHTHAFAGLPYLTRLELDGNSLTRIESQAFSGLGRSAMGLAVSLQSMPTLHHISPHAFSDVSVEILFISNTSLTNESLNALQLLRNSLLQLYLKDNTVPLHIPADLFQGFQFNSLDLKGNGIRNVNFLAYLQTEVLSMQDNPIGPTDFSRFPNSRSIRDLYLDNTGFHELNISYFNSLTSLERISLSNNNIMTISKELSPFFTRLSSISLADNPLHCNCKLAWLYTFVHRKRRTFSLDAHCASPKNISMFKMHPGDFKCEGVSDVSISGQYVDGRPVLVCEVNGDPYPTITWSYPDGDVITIPPAQVYSDELYIRNILILKPNATDGLYSCQAHNKDGNLKTTQYIDVSNIMAMKRSGHFSNSGPSVFGQLCVHLSYAYAFVLLFF